jgi:2-octaprenyl-6-methoxyphenol hydroxylase
MANRSAETRAAKSLTCDVAIVGAGPAGLTAAIALASNGAQAVCAGPPFNPDPARPDTRTTALLRGSVQLLKNIGVWPYCAAEAAPLDAIRIIDDTGRLLRAPEVEFRAVELGFEAFGFNIPNQSLVAALRRRGSELEKLKLIETSGADAVKPASNAIHVHLAEQTAIEARLVAGADGRHSICRRAAHINTIGWSYDQSAIACNFEHTLPHGNVSNEFHHPAGPFTTVPLPGNASSLVWVERPAVVERLMGLPDVPFREELESRLQGLLGRLTGLGPRAAFPLSGLTARRFARSRIALIGEAAHVIPPIGAQGLNLGFRDAAHLAELVGRALDRNADPGGETLLRAYDRARRSDVVGRTLAVDLLNRSLLSTFLPVQLARGFGLHLLSALSPLRRYVMRQGLDAESELPDLMRERASLPAV